MISSIKQNATPNGAAHPSGSPPAPSEVAPRRILKGVTKGKIDAAFRIMVYGGEGIGKTTLAAGAEDVIFLCKEGGTEQHDIARLPEPTHWRDAPEINGVRRDCFSLVEDLRQSDHEFKTLAIDTVDWIEPMVFRHVCETSKPKPTNSIVLAYGGYGKGYEVALDEWRQWLSLLDSLRKERRMNIMLLAHAQVKKFSNPEGEDYDRYQLKMNDKGAGVLKEWCDGVFFANQEVFAAEKEGAGSGGRKYGVGSTTRFLFTTRRPAWDAKNRFGMPEKLPLSWPDLRDAIKLGAPGSVAEMIARIQEQSAFISAERQALIPGMLERANGDPEKLALAINWVQSAQETV